MNLFLTDDGSHSIKDTNTGESYHSSFGAITESETVFINNGLKNIKLPEIKILEIGFGTGLNALLSLKYAIENNIQIKYTAIELFPLELNTILKLNYPEKTRLKKDMFYDIHNCTWDTENALNNNFIITKIKSDITKWTTSCKYNLIYFDAFSPESQPELWSEDIFRKMSEYMEESGLLVTYCVKGYVKRLLKQFNFKIELLQGPPGKRHVLRAIKL